MIYLDTSALVSLADDDFRAPALRDWLDRHARDRFTTSVLTRVELPRALHKNRNRIPIEAAENLLRDLEIIPLGDEELSLAARIPDRHLRSMDALHIAAAHRRRPAIHTFVTYDLKVARVMRTEMEVASPGV
jgi:predicted nucleic acid-binding protein